jgi:hypothetical protein
MKTALTSEQLDILADVTLNLNQKELERAIYSLTTQELIALRGEAQALINRQKKIIGLVDGQLEGLGR